MGHMIGTGTTLSMLQRTSVLNNDTGMPQSLAVPDLKNSVVDPNTLNVDPDSDLCPQI